MHSEKGSLHIGSISFNNEEMDSWPFKVTFFTLTHNMSAKGHAKEHYD